MPLISLARIVTTVRPSAIYVVWNSAQGALVKRANGDRTRADDYNTRIAAFAEQVLARG